MSDLTIEQAQADIAFLVLRASAAGSCSFSADRWTGMSSNALVSLAYGGKQDEMPCDRGDYAACVRTFVRLPKHRKTPEVREGLRKAKAALLARHPECRTPALRKAAQERWERESREWEGRLRKPRRRRARS